jgi:hypothetical protein
MFIILALYRVSSLTPGFWHWHVVLFTWEENVLVVRVGCGGHSTPLFYLYVVFEAMAAMLSEERNRWTEHQPLLRTLNCWLPIPQSPYLLALLQEETFFLLCKPAQVLSAAQSIINGIEGRRLRLSSSWDDDDLDLRKREPQPNM